MAQSITLLGAVYNNVPAVDLPKTGGGTARFMDVTNTTATASDVKTGVYFYTSGGTRTQGTASLATATISGTSPNMTLTLTNGFPVSVS